MTPCCIFPAFRMRYTRMESLSIPGLLPLLSETAGRAAAALGISEIELACGQPAPLVDDLLAHYRCYIEGCALGELVKRKLGAGRWTAGYSMGLYAALCHSGAVSFTDGLLLMRQTCQLARRAQEQMGMACGMAAFVGLTAAELQALSSSLGLTVEVADVGAARTVIMAGPNEALDRLVEAAPAAGCLRARRLPIALAYHSSQLRSLEADLRAAVYSVEFHRPQCALVSCVDQRVLETPEDLRLEAATNVVRPINWHRAVQRLVDVGATLLVECGFSDSLCKLALADGLAIPCHHPKNLVELLR